MSLDNSIKDTDIVVKYGFTDDLSRRTNEHVKEYEKKIKGSKLENINYVYNNNTEVYTNNNIEVDINNVYNNDILHGN